MNTKPLATLNEEDRKALCDTIYELDAAFELYQTAAKTMSLPREQVEFLFRFYMECLKVHKRLWTDLLNKYLGEDEASKFRSLCRYDIQKNLIFRLEVEGCALCQNGEGTCK
jgi:hypothetical protein